MSFKEGFEKTSIGFHSGAVLLLIFTLTAGYIHYLSFSNLEADQLREYTANKTDGNNFQEETNQLTYDLAITVFFNMGLNFYFFSIFISYLFGRYVNLITGYATIKDVIKWV